MTPWRRRFAQFAERKIVEALAARLPPYVTDVDRHDASAIAIGNDWTMRLLDGRFYLSPGDDAQRPSCSLVFVQSLDGNTGAKNPSTLGGGETDKHLIYEGLSRVAADAVLAGAATIRGGHVVLSVWHPELVALRASLGKPRHPIQIVATLAGLDVDGALMFNVPEIPVIVLTVGSCADAMREALAVRPWIKSVVMNESTALPKALETLRTLGVDRVSCIGGRRLATQLIDAGLVQDVYLTTAARAGGEPDTPMYPRPLAARVVVRKRGTGPEEGVVFEHLVVISQRAGSRTASATTSR